MPCCYPPGATCRPEDATVPGAYRSSLKLKPLSSGNASILHQMPVIVNSFVVR